MVRLPAGEWNKTAIFIFFWRGFGGVVFGSSSFVLLGTGNGT